MDKNCTINILEKEKCSGCSACYNVCPKNAISMKYDDEGFRFPEIDENLCVSCGLCKNICPALEPYKENDDTPTVYVVKRTSKEEKESTSAGVFAALAEYVLDHNGYVCGAVYDENLEVRHWIANDAEGVRRIKKSKYVQSEIGLIYRDIKSLLDAGKLVLFSGTPCQVAGLLKFLRKKYDNLITMDIFCHGVPAPMSWKRYLDENVDREKIKSIEFRHKGGHAFKSHYMRVEYNDGRAEVIHASKNPYYLHFTTALALRNSCNHCEGAVVPRVGDFSAGDYWGAKKYYPEWIEKDRGLSLMFLNNEKARRLFEVLKQKFSFLQEIPVSQAFAENRSKPSRKMHFSRERFFEMLQTTSFNEAVKKNVGKPFDVAIYGNTLSQNYGILIAYYALYKAIYNMGCGVVLIPPPKPEDGETQKTHAWRFMERNAIIATDRKAAKFSEYSELAKAFVLGTEQKVNLDFVKGDKKKIVYRELSDDNVELVAGVVDPIFLLSKEEYEKLATKNVKPKSGENIAVYVINPKKSFNKGVQFAAKTLKLPRVNMGDGNFTKLEKDQEKFDMPFCEKLKTEAWLYNMMNSRFVITDSYYGVCLALIFNKKFVVIQNKYSLARIKKVLAKFNLENHWFETGEDLMNHPEVLLEEIDYERINKILEKERAFSINCLANALGESL